MQGHSRQLSKSINNKGERSMRTTGVTPVPREEFAGASKVNTSFLKPLERRLEPIVLPRIPAWLGTTHLTMLTIVWCLGILGFSYLGARDRRWMWAVSLMILCQYLSDYFDGKIGKYRQTGLERWGYYMDHLLDYFFLGSVIIGYAFILPERSRYQLLVMIVLFAVYDMSAFLAFGACSELKISYMKFGPTEFRLALIIINGLVAQWGPRYMISGLKFVNAGAFVGLCILVYQTQKRILRIDMARKKANHARPVILRGDNFASCDNPDTGVNISVQSAPTLYELGSR